MLPNSVLGLNGKMAWGKEHTRMDLTQLYRLGYQDANILAEASRRSCLPVIPMLQLE